MSDWKNYIHYLEQWIKDHEQDVFEGMSPISWDEFLDELEEQAEWDEEPDYTHAGGEE